MCLGGLREAHLAIGRYDLGLLRHSFNVPRSRRATRWLHSPRRKRRLSVRTNRFAHVKETPQLPVWLVVVLTVVPAVVAGASAVLAAWLAGGRKAAKQLDQWRRREETMRILRWAADKATGQSDDERLLAVSVPDALDALDHSKPAMLQPEDQGILDGVLDAVLSDATAVVQEYPHESGNYDVEVADDG
jgi:hypothetical protein